MDWNITYVFFFYIWKTIIGKLPLFISCLYNIIVFLGLHI